MRALDILDHVSTLSGKKDKVEFLKSHNTNKELAELLDAALNFSRKFYIKKLDESLGESDLARKYLPYPNPLTPHANFIALLKVLENRRVTGHEALKLCNSAFRHFNDQEKDWFKRVLFKDLKAGFDISTANKAGFDIPKFDVMLAKDGNECKKLREIVQGGVYCSPKLDGYRCVAVCSFGNVSLHSRNGTEYQNFPSIVSTLEKWCQDSSFIMDGEIMSDDFNSMQQTAFASKRGTQVGDVAFHVFGLIPYDEWMSGKFKTLTKNRLDNLKLLVDSHDDENIRLVPQTLVHQVEDIVRLQAEYENQGYEGVMVLPNCPYYLGRKSNKLMKFKTMLSQDCKVVGIYEGTGKFEGLLGGMHLLQQDGKTRCDVGSGFTDEDRARIWSNPALAIGRTVEIKYQELTPDGVMRFPIFLRYRDDK